MGEYIGGYADDQRQVMREYPVANGVTVTEGDLVYLSSTGRITGASIGSAGRLLGIVAGVKTNDLITPGFKNTATGDAGGTVTVLVNVDPDAKYLLKCNNATNTLREASQGMYYNLTGATGAQVVDGASESASTGQLVCVKFNPGIRGTDSTYGVFVIAKNQVNL